MSKAAVLGVVLTILFAAPVLAGGPLVTVSSTGGTTDKMFHLNLIAKPQSGAVTNTNFVFSGFLMRPTCDGSPLPVEVVVNKEVGARATLNREGESQYWQLSVGQQLIVRLIGKNQRIGDTYNFVGVSDSSPPFSTSVVDDPTGLEVVALVASAALVICGTVVIYELATKDCEEEARKTCGEAGVKSVYPRQFGISIKKTDSLSIGCEAGCRFECRDGKSSRPIQ